MLKSIKIGNCKILRDVSLDFHPRMNLFVGINGSGKTTMLETMVKGCRCACDMFVSSSLAAPTGLLSDRDIMVGERDAEIDLTADSEFFGGSDKTWSLVVTRKGENKERVSSLGDLRNCLKAFRSEPAERFGQENNGSFMSLPVVVYYGTNRSVLEAPLKPRSHAFLQLEVYDGSFKGEANFKNFFIWFREREDIENEEKQDRGGGYEDRELSAVRRAMSAFLPGFSQWRVRRQPLRMEVNKHGTFIRVDDLSDGEKCLLSMVGDLARRLAMANPGMSDPLQGRGIVFIDEVELHLHPAWQFTLLPRLLDVFANIQFFLTTHSPQVLSSASSECLFAVTDGTVVPWGTAMQTQGQRVERLLVDVFNAPIAGASAARDEIAKYARMLKDGRVRSPEGEALYQNLVKLFGEDDPVMNALAYRRRELLSREGAVS